jgi:hypothetical protein
MKHHLAKILSFLCISFAISSLTISPYAVHAAGIPPQPKPVKADKAQILIQGSSAFINQANAALDQLTICAPDQLKIADKFITSIIESDRSGMEVDDGSFLASDTTAFAPGYSAALQVFWFAGTIVHDAHHSWQHENGINTDWESLNDTQRAAIETDARIVQIKVLKGCVNSLPKSVRYQSDTMIQYLQDMQDNPSTCSYCGVEWENRSW